MSNVSVTISGETVEEVRQAASNLLGFGQVITGAPVNVTNVVADAVEPAAGKGKGKGKGKADAGKTDEGNAGTVGTATESSPASQPAADAPSEPVITLETVRSHMQKAIDANGGMDNYAETSVKLWKGFKTADGADVDRISKVQAKDYAALKTRCEQLVAAAEAMK